MAAASPAASPEAAAAAAAAAAADEKDSPADGGRTTPAAARETFAEQLKQLTSAASAAAGLKPDEWTTLSASLLAMTFDERKSLSSALAAFVQMDPQNPKPKWTPATASSIRAPDSELRLPDRSKGNTTKSWRKQHVVESKIVSVTIKSGPHGMAAAFDALLVNGELQDVRKAEKHILKRLHAALTKAYDAKADAKAFAEAASVFRDGETGVCSPVFAAQVAEYAQGEHAEMSWTTRVWSRLTAMWATIDACYVECGVQLCAHKTIKPDELVALHFNVDKLPADQIAALRVFKKNQYGNFPLLVREDKPESELNAPDRAQLTVSAKICLMHQLKLLHALGLGSTRFTQPMPTAVMVQFCGVKLYVGLMVLRRNVDRGAGRGRGRGAAKAAAAAAVVARADAGPASECVAVWFPEVRFDTTPGLLHALNVLKCIHQYIGFVRDAVQSALNGAATEAQADTKADGEALEGSLAADLSVGVDPDSDHDDGDGDGDSEPAAARGGDDDDDDDDDDDAGDADDNDAGDENDGDGGDDGGADENAPSGRDAKAAPKANKTAPRGRARGGGSRTRNAAADQFAATLAVLAARFGKPSPAAPKNSAAITGLRKAAAHRTRQPLGPIPPPQRSALQTISEADAAPRQQLLNTKPHQHFGGGLSR